MNLLLAVLLLIQGIPILAADSGSVAGVLRNADGTPAAGVRIAALSQPERPEDTISAAALVSLTETDASGRFNLESIPPGRYYIMAGRLELPTYYPGTPEIGEGRSVQITPGARITGVDFILK